MIEQYLVVVQDSNHVDFLKDFGVIEDVTTLKNIVILRANHTRIPALEAHPLVIEVKKSRTFHLG